MLDHLNQDFLPRPLALVADRSWRKAKQQPPSDDGSLTVAEAAALLEVTTRTVRYWCEKIPGFGRRSGERSAWRVNLTVASYVGTIILAYGRMPIGTLVKETERHAVLMRGTLHMLQHPDAVEQIKAIIHDRMKKANSRPPRKRASPGAAEKRPGEVRHDER